MNKYRLPFDAYERTHEQQTISVDAIKDKLIGRKQKEIIDVIVDKDKMIKSEDKE